MLKIRLVIVGVVAVTTFILGTSGSAFAATTQTTVTRTPVSETITGLASVEAEHRAIGRAIGGMAPANNRAFSQVLLKQVADARGRKDAHLLPDGHHLNAGTRLARFS